MTEIKRIKINHILDSQIPEFLNEESPIFQEFLNEYYTSQEHQTGIVDLSSNIQKYKKIQNFNSETLIDLNLPSVLTSDVLSFDDTISVSHTIGYPSKYGLIKIDNEIITYTGITTNKFTGCIRGFSGIDSLEKDNTPELLNFSITEASEHKKNTPLKNLNFIFFFEIFKKFKYQFLPGFEERNLSPNISLENILSRARDFYSSKGTSQSFKILFSILYGSEIETINPQEYMLRPSDSNYFVTKNILVEKISGKNTTSLNGETLNQFISGIGTVTAAIYNVEYRPIKNKDFYEISLDSTSFTGNFEITGSTKVVETVLPSNNTITVDSTVGFAQSGTIIAQKTDLTQLTLNYTDKTSTQFLNVSGIGQTLYFGDFIYEKKLAYAYDNQSDAPSLNEFRIISVIDKIDTKNSSGLKIGDKISLSSFGKNLSGNTNFDSWIYNIPTYHNISAITPGDGGNYTITLKDNIKFYKGEKVVINIATTIPKNVSANITQIINPTQIDLDAGEIGLQNSDVNKIRIQKTINKTNFSNFIGISSINSAIQNTYIDKEEKYLYVTTSGFPNYQISSTNTKEVVPILTEPTTILTITGHNLSSGDKIYYDPKTSVGIETGIYFVKKIDVNNISLSYSDTNLFAEEYIKVGVGTTSGFIFKLGYENKTIKDQKILRKFNLTDNLNYFDNETSRTTFNRNLGLFINGVELYSPTLFDENIYYGKVDSIEITNPGKNYDVINPPELIISDSVGIGLNIKNIGSECKANLILSGSLKEVQINSPGIGYVKKPILTLMGGNGSGAVLESNLVKTNITAIFKSDSESINTSTDTITFISNHNFVNYEEILYHSNGNAVVPGLIENSKYFVNIINPKQIKLHKNISDVLVGIATINITGISSGFHEFRTLNSKNIINKIYVKNSGSGYSNRLVKVSSVSYPSLDYQISGISTFDDYIFAKMHGFKNGDFVVYSHTGTSISGLSTTTEYYITIIDKDKFKLSDAGIGTTSTNLNYINKKYIKFNSLGIGTHTFAYPPISIKIETLSGIGSTSIVSPVLTPIVLGSAESVYIENGGVSYGSSEIINFHRRPNVNLKPITSALLKPVIINGSITDIQIIFSGEGYDNGSEVIIYGEGKYADIKPGITDGKITSFIIIDGGVGYKKSNTRIEVVRRGKDLQFIANVFEWKINQIEKNKFSVEDETITFPNIDQSLGLKVINFYLPKALRKNIGDNINDDNNTEKTRLQHSPIVGWAYDGNPIYGPYGYTSLTDTRIKLINSSYTKKSKPNDKERPNSFVNGYFVNDYKFDNSGDLDEYNGRFCKTTEYPYGTYAYFATFDIISNGNNENEVKPKYPYVIGNYFKDIPVIENFDPNFTQDLDLKNLNLIRNTANYFLDSENSGYDVLTKNTPELKQDFIVKQIKKSGITSISIDSSGENYRIKDAIIFKNEKEGVGAGAEIDRVFGKTISNLIVGVSTFNDVVFATRGNKIVGITSTVHNLVSNDKVIISGISTFSLSQLEGTKTIVVNQKVVGLTSSLPNFGVTGVSTNINVTDISGFEVNDSIGIGTEILTITNIIPETSQLLVNRLASGGIHTAGIDSVKLLPKKFEFTEVELNSSFLPENQEVYFNPKNSVGFGTTGTNYSLVGIGVSNIVNRFVPSRVIYIPNHKFYTGQQLTYDCPVGSGIGISVYNSNPSLSFSLTKNQTIYAVNLGNNYLGISTLGFTDPVGIGNTLNSLYFISNSNVSDLNSFKTTYKTVTARVENYSGIVSTSEPHNLIDRDKIKFTIIPSRTENVSFRFDKKNRKITTDLIGFSTAKVSTGSTSTIDIGSNILKNGDKIVYYSGTTAIGGLENESVYYVLKEHPDKIQLCKYSHDVTIGFGISFSNAGIGTQNIALINPPLSFSKGNTVVFDISNLFINNNDKFILNFYIDQDFKKQFEIDKKQENILAIGRTNTSVSLQTKERFIPKTLYYKFTPVSSDPEKNQLSIDKEVFGFNRIDIRPSNLSGEHSIIGVSSNIFKFNLKQKPEYVEYTQTTGNSSVFYDTDSKNASGPISKVKINSKGISYPIIPSINFVKTSSGKSALLTPISDEIGEILSFDRIKNGFDYPTDPTILPQLSVPAVCIIKEISRVDSIGILTGGKNYNTPPKLKVIGNDQIELISKIQGGSVISVEITKNVFDLKNPFKIVPYNNSNGYEIDDITVDNNGDGIINLVNDPVLFEPIAIGYGSTITEFPFAIGDSIFIEKCRSTVGYASSATFNSKDYDYNFFTVTGINTTTRTINYNMNGLQTKPFGVYNSDFTLGYVVNKKDMPIFEMNIIDDAQYFSGEKVSSTNFSAQVMEDGWDNDINQLRLINVKGVLNVGDKLYGEKSKLNGVVKFVSTFDLSASLGVSRDKINNFDDKIGFLNDYQQRISDNNYYQKFSYSIKSEVPYSTWKESVKSIIHPSGFKEFSDLDIITMPSIGPVNLGIAKSTNMKVSIASSETTLLVNMDSFDSLYTKHNFSMVYEEDVLDDKSVERIYFPEGIELMNFILNKTNKVLSIDDISSQFTGITSTIGGEVVGLSSFKLKSAGNPLFYKEFAGFATTIVDLTNNKFIIPNHGFQSGQEIIYNSGDGTSIGIAATFHAPGITLPSNVFVRKIDVNNFQLCGVPTAISSPFDLTSVGSGTQSFSFKNQNENVIISIDNIIQSAVHQKNITIGLSTSIGIGSTAIYISSGINSISGSDILKINNEFLKVISVGIGSTNKIDVARSFMGTVAAGHTIGSAVTVHTGDFNIIKDVIYFSTPPYGPAIASTDPQFKVSSFFSGRAFSRAFDSSSPNDKNLILDDISADFTGIAATQFNLKSNGNVVVGLYTNTNSSTDINNNPIILINNVFQRPSVDYSIDTPGNNTIKFLTGVPNAGKIINVAITTGFGYQPLIGAAATASVSNAGIIDSITIKGGGSGYRTPPSISIASDVGSGASITSTVGVGGSLSSLSIVSGGIGYTSSSPVYVNIDSPLEYSNLGVAYTSGSSGVGTNAKVSVQVGSGSGIIGFNLDNPGVGYKVGDILKVVGLTTNPTIGAGFEEFKLTVTETLTDKFSGFYPGQFIYFDDFSQYFDGFRKKFTLTQTNGGNTEIIDLRKEPGSDLVLQNNIFIYLNDILQVPGESYTFFGSRIVFSEAPKPNSLCSVIFYRGSSLDVETVTPLKTIKEGDIVQIGENINDNLDREQFERVVKKIVASDQLDTYNYDSIGINTNPDKIRPLKWTKQTEDRVILGSLVSKARPNLIPTIRPTTRIIKNLNTTDTSIYVNNAYPLFNDVDPIQGSEDNILIIDNKETSSGLGTAVVSDAGIISNVAISTGGSGYTINSPTVSFSHPQSQIKEPIFNWLPTSGLSTTSSLLSVVIGNPIVAVGQSGIVVTSIDGKSFNTTSNIGYAGTINFNSVGLGLTNYYIAVGEQGKIVRSVGFGTTISSWSEIKKFEVSNILGGTVPPESGYVAELEDIKYSSYYDKWICVGAGGSIFNAVGVGSTSFKLVTSNTTSNLRSIAIGIGLIVVVGGDGGVRSTDGGTSWSVISGLNGSNLNKVIWTGSQFVAVGSQASIKTSTDGNTWNNITSNLTSEGVGAEYIPAAYFRTIHYNSVYKLYTVLTSKSSNNRLAALYYSYNLSEWTRKLYMYDGINILKDINYSIAEDRYISVGSNPTIYDNFPQSWSITGTSFYSIPSYNFASATSNATSGTITSITITNPGFGYKQSDPPKVLIQSEKTKIEEIESIKAKGDFGVIVGIDTSLSGIAIITGSNTIPRIKFKLKTESYDNTQLGIGYSALNSYGIQSSGISVGDYFVIYNSNIQCGHALTCITTDNVVVGTATSFIDGVYYAEAVEKPINSSVVGIVTVTCRFLPDPLTGTGINFTINPGLTTNGYFGNYSWGKIYDYQNRSLGSPKAFTANTNNGLVGLSTAPEVTRTRGLFKSK